MQITEILSDNAILEELGKRLQEIRISENITQSQLSKKTGISLSTIARMEQGYPVKLDSLISVMRELKILENLNLAFPIQELKPMDLIQTKEKQRKRASKLKAETIENNWKWGDEV